MTLPTFSPTAWQILATLMNEPSGAYHLRQLSRTTGKSVRPVQLALDELEAARVLIGSLEGNRRTVALNRRHPFYPGLRLLLRVARPVRSLPPLTAAMVETIAAAQLGQSNPAEIEVVGSSKEQIIPPGEPITLAVGPAAFAGNPRELERTVSQKLRRKVRIITK